MDTEMPGTSTGSPEPCRPETSPVVLVRGLQEGMARLAVAADAVHATGWAFEERSAVVRGLDRLIELASVYRAAVLRAHKSDGRWARAGDRSFEAYRGRTSQTGTGTARAEMELAEGLAALPQAEQAVREEQVSLGHARELARLHARSTQAVRNALVDGGAAELLAAATGMDVPTFAKRAASWAASKDSEAAERSFEAVRRRRYVRSRDRDGGGEVSAFLDPLALATFRTALEAYTPPPSPGDDRSPEQRAADGLVALLEGALGTGDARIGAQIRPHISLLVPAETWTRMNSRRRRRSGAGEGGGATTGTDGAGGTGTGRSVEDGADLPVPLPELDDGTVLPTSELERLACDCEITRIVLDADGIPLDVGQTQRTYTKALRRAVLVRDGHCRWPGCTMRGSWCEVHHVIWFSHGGATSLENALTLCTFHHREVHRRFITIEDGPEATTFTRPDGWVIGTSAPAAGRRRLTQAGRRPAIRGRGPAAPERVRATARSSGRQPPQHLPRSRREDRPGTRPPTGSAPPGTGPSRVGRTVHDDSRVAIGVGPAPPDGELW